MHCTWSALGRAGQCPLTETLCHVIILQQREQQQQRRRQQQQQLLLLLQ